MRAIHWFRPGEASLAFSRSIGTAVTELAVRLRRRMRNSHLSLERRMKRVLDESASPSCCVQDKVERVKELAIPKSCGPGPKGTAG